MNYFLVVETNKHNLRNFKEMKQQKIKTIPFGLEITLYYDPKEVSLKSLHNVNLFQSKIKYCK